MTQIQRIIVAALLFLFLLTQSLFAEQIKQSKNVLVLYSEDTEHPAHKLTEIGIRKTFRSNKQFDVQLYTEYLDMSRFRSPAHSSALVDYLSRKYADMKIDAIITTYPPTMDLLLGEARAAFPGVPIIASPVSLSYGENLDKSPSRSFVTGAIMGENITGVLDYALRIRPDTKRVALISGAGPNDTYGEQIFRNGLKPYSGKLELIDLTRLPMEDILAKVKSLPPNTIILYSALFRDGAGKSFVPREALSQISLAANAPVFGLYDTLLGHGIVGGRLVSFERLGNEAAELTLRILGGEAPASIPFGGQQAYVNLYDGRELKRWGISETTVLPGSEIRYRQPSLWEQYSLVIIGVAVIIMLELALILGLLTNILRRRKAEGALIESETRVRLAVWSAGAGLWTLNTATGLLWVSNKAREMMGVALDAELNSEKFLTLVHPEDRERVGLAMRQTFQPEQDGRIEYRVVLADGNVRWIESFSSRLHKTAEDENSLTGVSVDITERKSAEEDRRQYQEKLEALVEERTASLRESEKKFRSMFENSLDGILFTTQEGEILNANEAACEMLGRTKEQLCEIGREGVVDKSDFGLADAMGGRLLEGRWKGKLDFKRSDGTIFPVEVSSNIFKDEHGNERAVIAIRDITERKRMEDELRNAKEEWEKTFNAVPDLIIILSNDHKIIRVNRAMAERLGLHAEDCIGLICYETVHGTDAPPVFCPHCLLLDDGKEHSVEVHEERLGGDYIVTASPLLDSGGHIFGSVHVARDITERKQAEVALRESEALFRTAIDASPDGFVITDMNGYIQMASPSILRMRGCEREEDLLGHFGLEFYLPEDWDYCKSYITRVLDKENPGPDEFRAVRVDGSLIDIESNGVLILGADGQPTGLLYIMRDITQRKLTEDALRISQEKFTKAFMLSPDVIMYSRLDDGKIAFVNEAFKEIFGDDETIIGKTGLEINLWDDPEDRKKVYEILEAEGKLNNFEFFFRNKYGDKRCGLMSAGVLEVNGVEYLLTFGRDITDNKRLEAERLEMERKLLHAQKLESLGVMAGGIAHDFNNLLMAIMGGLEFALDDPALTTKTRSSIETAMRASERSAELSRQMLIYSGSAYYTPKELDLGELANKLAHENEHLFISVIPQTTTLNFKINQGLPLIRGDADQIQRVITNLVINASEAIGKNSGDVTLKTSVMDCDESYLGRSRLEEKPEPGEFVFVEVTDTGCGMDAETQHKLFDPFFTTKFWGRGLGMAEVMGTVKGHHGAITVDSEVGKGTTIRVLFPVATRVQPLAVTDVEIAETGSSVPDSATKRKTVLVVDDEELVRNMVLSRLEVLGYDTISAVDGAEGVHLFRERLNEIDLVLLDFAMPRMNGVEAFGELRRMRPDVKVILSSGYTEDAVSKSFPGPKPAGFLSKPYKLEALKAELDRLLGIVG
jgi:PAS domain S-box-containing protein